MAALQKPCSPSQHTGYIVDRVLQIPAVSSTVNILQAAYASVKEAHPLVASVCTVYEKGILGAGSLAWWSMQPVVHRMAPQIMAANELACRSLDSLQEMVPALQYPPEKITSELTESISAAVNKARSCISGPVINSTSNQVLGVVASGFALTRHAADYAHKSQASRLVVGGVNAALGKAEKLTNSCIREPEVTPVFEPLLLYSEPQPGPLNRIGKLARTIFHRTYALTTKAIHKAQCRGQQELAFWFPSLIPLTAGSMRVLGSMAQNLQSTYLSTVSKLKRTPSVLLDTAGEVVQVTPRKSLLVALEVMELLGGPVIRAIDSMLKMVSQHTPFGRFFASKEEVKANSEKNLEDHVRCQEVQESRLPAFTSSGRHDASAESQGLNFGRATPPPSVSAADDTRALQQRGLERLPVQCLEESTNRKSAFTPYKEASRKRSEGSGAPSVESTYTRSFYSSLHVTTIKKD